MTSVVISSANSIFFVLKLNATGVYISLHLTCLRCIIHMLNAHYIPNERQTCVYWKGEKLVLVYSLELILLPCQLESYQILDLFYPSLLPNNLICDAFINNLSVIWMKNTNFQYKLNTIPLITDIPFKDSKQCKISLFYHANYRMYEIL